MATYVVTGASRGLGYAFIKLLAADPANTVVGIVRDKSATEKKLAEEGIDKVHVYEADTTDLKSMKVAAAAIHTAIGSVDYLICNAAYSSQTTYHHLGEFETNPETLENELKLSFQTNVIGLINTINTFMSLIKASQGKKIIALTSGMGDCDFVNETGIDGGAPYSISKAGVNMVVAKFDATYKKDGILVMGICAGSVNTQDMGDCTMRVLAPDGNYKSLINHLVSDDEMAKMQAMFQKITAYAPHFAGPVSANIGAKSIMKVVHAASLENGNGGKHLSYMGTKKYL